jgi:two-component system cell cycle sensor histidine kinase/response regulator CckA
MSERNLRPLQVLLVEDDPMDAELIVQELERAGFDPVWQRVDNEAEYLAALNPQLDIILADFSMPGFGAPRALELLNARDFDIPFIVVSGSIGEETAVRVLTSGAADYLLKDRMARLGRAVERALSERRLQRAKRKSDRALAAAEERMRFALEASRVGIWEVDGATGAARWSEIMEALHGIPAGTFRGTFEAFIDRVHPEDRQPVREGIESAIRKQTDSHTIYRTTWPDGSLHWISSVGRSLHSEGGATLRATGIGMDVTEYHVLEEQYRQSQKIEAIGQLAGGVAHDFNNILTAIQGFSELLCEELGPDSPHQADLGEIKRAADRAATLTRQLLAFSRRQIVEPRVFDLRDSLTAMEALLRPLIGENVTVVVTTAPDVGPVTADPGQIEQVILNLALNARDAMPQGGSLLMELANVELDESYVRQHVGAVPGQYVMLAVSDTGAGMDAETREHIFEPFFTTKERGKGTGLGLSTVFGIVKQSGGCIGVYSELGSGSTFKVYLPRANAPADAPVDRPMPESLDGSEVVLVVEDEKMLRDLVQKVLERHGYQVLMSATPHEALDVSRKRPEPIQLLLADVVLPQMSGTVLAESIMAERPSIRVLFMSGYTENTIVHRGVLDSQMPFIHKPFMPEALLRKIKDVLN